MEPDDDQDEDNKWGEKKDLDENPNYLDQTLDQNFLNNPDFDFEFNPPADQEFSP